MELSAALRKISFPSIDDKVGTRALWRHSTFSTQPFQEFGPGKLAIGGSKRMTMRKLGLELIDWLVSGAPGPQSGKLGGAAIHPYTPSERP
jgi:hypothetical protein